MTVNFVEGKRYQVKNAKGVVYVGRTKSSSDEGSFIFKLYNNDYLIMLPCDVELCVAIGWIKEED